MKTCWLVAVVVTLTAGVSSVSATEYDVCAPPYNAAGDGVANDRLAIQAAIDAAAGAGGGVVLLQTNKTFLTGTLELKTGVTLRIATHSVLKSSLNPAHYPHAVQFGRRFPGSPYAWDDKYQWNYPLLYAGPGTANIKVLGPGTIETGEVAGADDDSQIFLSPIGFFQVTDFELADFKTRRTKGYNLQLHGCSRGDIHGVDIRDPYTGGDLNCDGISMEGCQDLHVHDCFIETNDDMIYVWSSWQDPRGRTWWNSNNPQPTRNILVENNWCRMVAHVGAHGFVIIAWGGAASDVEQVAVEDVVVRNNYFEAGYPLGVLRDDPYFDEPTHPPLRRITFQDNVLVAYDHHPLIELRGATITEFVNVNNGPPASEPEIRPAAGSHIAPLTVTLVTRRPGASIRFTTDGSLPTPVTGTLYTGPFLLTNSATVSAMSFGVGLSNSSVSTAGFTLVPRFSGLFSLYGDTLPGLPDDSDRRSYELGVKLQSIQAGRITKLRYLRSVNETGAHTGRVWSVTGTQLASVEFTNETAAGWQEQALPVPLDIAAHMTYVVSVNINEHYAAQNHALATALASGPIQTVADGANGVYADLGQFPTSSYQNSDYFRDIVFVPYTASEEWKTSYGLPAEAPDDSDTDGDGIPLLLEYAFGIDPLTASAAPVSVEAGNYLTLTSTKNKAATEVTILAEVAGSVTGPWSSAPLDVDQLWQVTDGLTTQTITARDQTPVSTATRRFMRLKVTQP